MLAIRMTRHGAKKRPFFHIVVADSRSPRDGRFIEKLGTYNPLLPREHAQRITLDKERIAHWLKVGAQPSDRVAKFLAQAEMMKPRERREQTKKPQPRAKAQERMKAAAAAAPRRLKAARPRRPPRADEARTASCWASWRRHTECAAWCASGASPRTRWRSPPMARCRTNRGRSSTGSRHSAPSRVRCWPGSRA